MISLRGMVYLGAVLLWVAYGVLVPTWVGRSYTPVDPGNPQEWFPGGVFGLRGANGFYAQAPIWSPPTAHSGAIRPSVRWPWQRPSMRDHVEIALARVCMRWSAGILALGLVGLVINRIRPLKEPDLILSIGWFVSLSLVIAWLCILALAAFSMGYAATDAVVVAVLSLGALAGLFFGARSYWRTHSGLKTVEKSSSQSRPVGSGLLRFTVGVILAFCITWAIGSIAAFCRGPVVGVWELGTPRYALGQTLVNVMAGLGILLSGWLPGILMLRRRLSREFALGLILATTGLGILFALH